MAGKTVTIPNTDEETAPYGFCRVCAEERADGLFVGKKHDSYSDRVLPYRGYVCDQCAGNLRDDTGERGRWEKHWRPGADGTFVYPGVTR